MAALNAVRCLRNSSSFVLIAGSTVIAAPAVAVVPDVPAGAGVVVDPVVPATADPALGADQRVQALLDRVVLVLPVALRGNERVEVGDELRHLRARFTLKLRGRGQLRDFAQHAARFREMLPRRRLIRLSGRSGWLLRRRLLGWRRGRRSGRLRLRRRRRLRLRRWLRLRLRRRRCRGGCRRGSRARRSCRRSGRRRLRGSRAALRGGERRHVRPYFLERGLHVRADRCVRRQAGDGFVDRGHVRRPRLRARLLERRKLAAHVGDLRGRGSGHGVLRNAVQRRLGLADVVIGRLCRSCRLCLLLLRLGSLRRRGWLLGCRGRGRQRRNSGGGQPGGKACHVSVPPRYPAKSSHSNSKRGATLRPRPYDACGTRLQPRFRDDPEGSYDKSPLMRSRVKAGRFERDADFLEQLARRL